MSNGFPPPKGALQLTICSLDASSEFRKRQIWKTIALCSLLLSSHSYNTAILQLFDILLKTTNCKKLKKELTIVRSVKRFPTLTMMMMMARSLLLSPFPGWVTAHSSPPLLSAAALPHTPTHTLPYIVIHCHILPLYIAPYIAPTHPNYPTIPSAGPFGTVSSNGEQTAPPFTDLHRNGWKRFAGLALKF